MEILDINFNVDDTENIVKDARYACDEAIKNAEDDIAEYNEYIKFEWTKMGRPFKRLEIEQSVQVAMHAFDNLNTSIDFLVTLFQSRESFIRQNNSQDQIQSNYKLRQEVLGISKNIEKYNRLKQLYKQKRIKLLEMANGLSDQNQPENY